MMSDFELVLVSADIDLIIPSVLAGVNTILIDWERHGKKDRQQGYDTLISENTLEDLKQVRQATKAPLICRLNSLSTDSAQEVEAAIAWGADELLFPMVRSIQEVDQLLYLVNNRVNVGIMLETVDICHVARDLGTYPLSRVFVGL